MGLDTHNRELQNVLVTFFKWQLYATSGAPVPTFVLCQPDRVSRLKATSGAKMATEFTLSYARVRK
jgi:hypothetical protein